MEKGAKSGRGIFFVKNHLTGRKSAMNMIQTVIDFGQSMKMVLSNVAFMMEMET